MTTTGIFLVVTAIIVAIYDAIDVILSRMRGASEDSTVSKFLQTVGIKSPTFCLCVGILIGHFFCRIS